MPAARKLCPCMGASSWPDARQRMTRLRSQHARPKRSRAWLPGGAGAAAAARLSAALTPV